MSTIRKAARKNFKSDLEERVEKGLEEIKPSIVIQLKDKIDEKVFSDILVKEGLTSISMEIKNSEKSNVYNLFKFGDKVNLININNYYNTMGLDAENSCIYITKIISLKEVSESTLGKSFGFLTNPTTTLNNPNKKSNDIIKYVLGEKDFIESVKEILFREKILDKVYDKSKEYKKNPKKYEANTDDIIEKIEEENTEPYNLFIIKHFIKYVMDKYKQENHSSEDNSTNENIENNEDTKNISKNPFIED